MKKPILLISLLFLLIVGMNAQDFSLKYGKVTPEEISMTSYEKDTTANALVIFQLGDVIYDYTNNGFRITYEYETKIKVFNQEGVEHADVLVSLYHEEKQNLNKETISRIEAFAYNMENGKVVKTKMDKSYIYEERVSPYWKQTKFSIPNVKAGTVLEYRYRIHSDFIYNISDWNIQRNIPVHFAQYDVKIPEYYKYSFEMKGYEKIDVKEESFTQTFVIPMRQAQSEQVQSIGRRLTFTSNDVPTLKNDGYVWCLEDFSSSISFELHGISFPMSPYKPFSRTWDDIENTLKESSSFGDNLSMRNPFRDEMKALSLEDKNTTEKIRAIYQLAKSKISWNDTYGFYSDKVRNAVKEGSGTNAEINFVLLSMLKDAGIEAYPILLSRRTRGRLPYTYPSINKINTFIVGAIDEEGNMVYMDGSTTYGDINILSPILMVDRARLFNPGGSSKWIDLTTVGRNSIRVLVNSSIDEEGKLTGKRQTMYGGYYSFLYKAEFDNAKDSVEYITEYETEKAIKIHDYEHTGMEKYSDQVREAFDFSKEVMSSDGYIYFNPMIFPHTTKNSFIEEERKLPVEFSFPYDFRLSTTFTIPEGYEVEEIPKNIRFSNEDGSLNCLYNIQQSGNQIVLNYTLQFKKVIFSQLDYPSLKVFWETLVQKNTEQVVLKKVNN